MKSDVDRGFCSGLIESSKLRQIKVMVVRQQHDFFLFHVPHTHTRKVGGLGELSQNSGVFLKLEHFCTPALSRLGRQGSINLQG